MNNKQIISLFFSVVFAFVSVSSVQAQTSSPSEVRPTKAAKMDRAEKMEKMQEQRTENSLERLKKKATKELERRIAALTRLLTVINQFKKISASEKASLSAQIQAEIDALNALKAKIAADTDIETLRTDVQSIVKDYRIFALFIPKIHIIANADRLLTAIEMANELANNLEKRLNETTGQDVSAQKALLISMRSHLDEAKKQAENAKTTVSSLTPEGFPGNKTELKKAREMLRLGHQQLVLARQDARKIMQNLHKKDKPSISVTVVPSTTVTCTPRPACLDSEPACLIAEPAEGWCPQAN